MIIHSLPYIIYVHCTIICDDLLDIILQHLDHREEAVSILLVTVPSLQPDQKKFKRVAKFFTVPSPDLKGRSSLRAMLERVELLEGGRLK